MANQDIPNNPSLSVLEQMNQDVFGVIWDRGEDKSVKGLHLRIFESGKRCFYFYYVSKYGIRRRPKIGEGIGLSEARKIASKWREQVLMGLDPKGDIDGKRREPTVDDVFRKLYESYYNRPRFLESGRAREVENIYKARIEKPFGHKKISSITANEIRFWHHQLEPTPFMANRALEVLGKIYSYALEQEIIVRNPVPWVKAFPERKRKRVPTHEELKNILQTLYRIGIDLVDPDNHAAIGLLALFYTGARPSMLVAADWRHCNSDSRGGFIVKLRGKMSYLTNEDESIYIPKQIADLLALYPKREDGKIFTGARARGLWQKILKDFGYANLWTRDARKAFASVGLSKGLSIDLIGNALNHKSAETTKTYAREFDNRNVETTKVVASELDRIMEGDK